MTSITLASLLNPWVIFGFIAQFLFFSRFIVQLYATERRGYTFIPQSFWYLSIIGGSMILVYAFYRQDIVFIVGQGIALIIYIRNLIIARKNPKEMNNGLTQRETS
jgi:lipid-A-disaccharide synthase-like uncharacterized protein